MVRNIISLWLFSNFVFLIAPTFASQAIVGGELAGIDQFKYQVALLHFNQLFCGGTIIADTVVLTAAHCVVKIDNEIDEHHIDVVAGTNDYLRQHPPAVVVAVKKIYVPREFDIRSPFTTSGDIAVLRLAKRLGLTVPNQSNLQHLKLAANEFAIYSGKTVRFTGFGYNYMAIINGREEGGHIDNLLRSINATVLTNDECQRLYPYRRINASQLCAKVHQRDHRILSGVCNGDSGGPLVYGETIIGILSSSPVLCSEVVKSGIYTRVTHYESFLKTVSEDQHSYDIRTRVLIP